MDKEQLTAHLRGDEEYKIGAIAVDLAQKAWDYNQPQTTDFLDPYGRKIVASVLGGIPEVGFITFGGHKNSERARLVIYPQFFLVETIQTPLAILEITGKFNAVNVSHRDFLGSLLGTGLKRDKIGDIIITDNGCQVVVATEVADFLRVEWTKVGSVSIQISEIDEEQLAIEPERIKEIKTTVASLRLDAVAAAGYGSSRTKMVRDIKADRVKVNWKPITNPALEVAAGDVLSIRGRGRVIIEEIRGTTRKGRTSILLHRYL